MAGLSFIMDNITGYNWDIFGNKIVNGIHLTINQQIITLQKKNYELVAL